jgi:hypothetical protein
MDFFTLPNYIEYKNELSFQEYNYKKQENYIRIGGQGQKFYYEVGPMFNNDSEFKMSAELGYKFKFDLVEVKGKWELKDKDHKLETEIRYKW